MNKVARETRWWWIRHAPVPDLARIYGQADVDCDCSSAEVFAALARELPRDAVWLTSNLNRTRQTAAAVLAAMKQDVELAAVPEFAEQHLGDWQGQVRADFFANRAARHPFWFGPASERPPGGETFVELCSRVSPAIERLTAQHAGRDIVAVGHGGSIKAALGHALGLDADAVLAFVIDNCSLTRMDQIDNGDGRFWRVSAVNHRPWLGAKTESKLA